jgi:hypothetical protein
VFFQELQTMYGGKRPVNIGAPVSAAANQAQIVAAVTDANCTQSADLAGIYFAVQASYEQQLVNASYEQQLVNANAQALGAAVRQYQAAYAKELSELPALLRATSAIPELPHGPSGPGGPGPAGGSSGSRGPRPVHS